MNAVDESGLRPDEVLAERAAAFARERGVSVSAATTAVLERDPVLAKAWFEGPTMSYAARQDAIEDLLDGDLPPAEARIQHAKAERAVNATFNAGHFVQTKSRFFSAGQ